MAVPGPLDPPRREFLVHGASSSGKAFRPSDWAETLRGVLAPYRPGGVLSGRETRIGYSPLVQPVLSGAVKWVVVDDRLREIERQVFDFVINLARDNDRQVYEACCLTEPAPIILA